MRLDLQETSLIWLRVSFEKIRNGFQMDSFWQDGLSMQTHLCLLVGIPVWCWMCFDFCSCKAALTVSSFSNRTACVKVAEFCFHFFISDLRSASCSELVSTGPNKTILNCLLCALVVFYYVFEYRIHIMYLSQVRLPAELKHIIKRWKRKQKWYP